MTLQFEYLLYLTPFRIGFCCVAPNLLSRLDDSKHMGWVYCKPHQDDGHSAPGDQDQTPLVSSHHNRASLADFICFATDPRLGFNSSQCSSMFV